MCLRWLTYGAVLHIGSPMWVKVAVVVSRDVRGFRQLGNYCCYLYVFEKQMTDFMDDDTSSFTCKYMIKEQLNQRKTR